MAKRDRQVVDALLGRFGTTFAEELGFDLTADKPSPLFRLLTTSVVLATNLNHQTTLRGAKAVGKWRSAHAMAEAGAEEVQAAFHDARMQRTQAMGRQLHDAAVHCDERWGGDLRKLRAEADRDPEAISALLQEHKGLGPTGAGIFLREVQVVWEEARPTVDDRGLEVARRLGLPHDPEGLATLVDGPDIARLAAALVRASFDDEAVEELSSAGA